MKYSPEIYSKLDIPDNGYAKLIEDLTLSKESKLVTFNGSQKTPIHSWFYYKQAFSPTLLNWILTRYGKCQDESVYDPFCGIGTTLLSAKENAIPSTGVDISPLCAFVSKAKTLDYNVKDLVKIRKKLKETSYHQPSIEYPDIKIIQRAFTQDMENKILFLKEEIEKIEDETSNDFFKLALLSILQDVILCKRDGAFLRMVSDKKVEDPINFFNKKTYKMIHDLQSIQTNLEFQQASKIKDNKTSVKIFEADAREFQLNGESITKVVTSPPYLNRYDYTRIYSPELSLYFINNFDELKQIRYKTLRSHVEARYTDSDRVKSDLLNQTMEAMKSKELSGEINNPSIPPMVKGYFEDTYLYLQKICTFLREDGIIAIAVGNSRWSGVMINTDLIICDIASQLGLFPCAIHVCKMRGTSAQQVKKYGEQQVRESIVVFKKIM